MRGELPPWPKSIAGPTTDAVDALTYQTRRAEAAIARLREAKEWLTVLRHPPGCGVHWPRHFGSCDCGLDKFIEDMLPEGEE